MQQIPGINAEILKRFAPNPGRKPLLPQLSEQAQVALMCRMLFREGWNEHIAVIALPDANGFPFLWEAMARRELREDPGILD